MKHTLLIAETRDVVRAGLKNIFASHEDIVRILEARTGRDIEAHLSASAPNLTLIHHNLFQEPVELPRGKFVVFATEFDKHALLKAYMCGARGYLMESCPMELMQLTLNLPTPTFLLDPTLTSEVMDGINQEFFAVPTACHQALTTREQEILSLLRLGLTNREIGKKLCIANTTVKTHVASIFRKLDIKRRYLATLPLAVN